MPQFYCLHCGQHIDAPDDLAGTRAACPACSGNIEVPSLELVQENAQQVAEKVWIPSKNNGYSPIIRRDGIRPNATNDPQIPGYFGASQPSPAPPLPAFSPPALPSDATLPETNMKNGSPLAATRSKGTSRSSNWFFAWAVSRIKSPVLLKTVGITGFALFSMVLFTVAALLRFSGSTQPKISSFPDLLVVDTGGEGQNDSAVYRTRGPEFESIPVPTVAAPVQPKPDLPNIPVAAPMPATEKEIATNYPTPDPAPITDSTTNPAPKSGKTQERRYPAMDRNMYAQLGQSLKKAEEAEEAEGETETDEADYGLSENKPSSSVSQFASEFGKELDLNDKAYSDFKTHSNLLKIFDARHMAEDLDFKKSLSILDGATSAFKKHELAARKIIDRSSLEIERKKHLGKITLEDSQLMQAVLRKVRIGIDSFWEVEDVKLSKFRELAMYLHKARKRWTVDDGRFDFKHSLDEEYYLETMSDISSLDDRQNESTRPVDSVDLEMNGLVASVRLINQALQKNVEEFDAGMHKAGLYRVIDWDRVAKDLDFEESLKILRSLNATVEKHQTLGIQLTAKLNKRLAQPESATVADSDETQDLKRALKEGLPKYDDLWLLNSEVIREFKDVLVRLHGSREHWYAKNGSIFFERDADREVHDAALRKIDANFGKQLEARTDKGPPERWTKVIAGENGEKTGGESPEEQAKRLEAEEYLAIISKLKKFNDETVAHVRAYMKGLTDLGTSDFLSSDRLAADKSFAQSKKFMEETRKLFESHGLPSIAASQKLKDEITAHEFTSPVDAKLKKDFLKEINRIAALTEELWLHEGQKLSHAGKAVEYLHKNRSTGRAPV